MDSQIRLALLLCDVINILECNLLPNRAKTMFAETFVQSRRLLFSLDIQTQALCVQLFYTSVQLRNVPSLAEADRESSCT